MKRAKEHLGQCEDTDCMFAVPNNARNAPKRINALGEGFFCAYGMRHVQCYMEPNEEAELRVQEIILINQKAAENVGDEYLSKLTKEITEKVFNFVFNGHEYTASDSSRAQNTCPHCNYKNPSGMMFKEHSPGVIFLGEKDFGNYVVHCFECLQCGKYFYYHLWEEQT